MKTLLRQGGVYTRRRNGSIGQQLADLLEAEDLPEWNKEEFAKVTFDTKSRAYCKQQGLPMPNEQGSSAHSFPRSDASHDNRLTSSTSSPQLSARPTVEQPRDSTHTERRTQELIAPPNKPTEQRSSIDPPQQPVFEGQEEKEIQMAKSNTKPKTALSPKTQLGYVFTSANKTSKDNVSDNLIYWSSTQCKRGTRSTLASESYGMIYPFDPGITLATTLKRFIQPCPAW